MGRFSGGRSRALNPVGHRPAGRSNSRRCFGTFEGSIRYNPGDARIPGYVRSVCSGGAGTCGVHGRCRDADAHSDTRTSATNASWATTGGNADAHVDAHTHVYPNSNPDARAIVCLHCVSDAAGNSDPHASVNSSLNTSLNPSLDLDPDANPRPDSDPNPDAPADSDTCCCPNSDADSHPAPTAVLGWGRTRRRRSFSAATCANQHASSGTDAAPGAEAGRG